MVLKYNIIHVVCIKINFPVGMFIKRNVHNIIAYEIMAKTGMMNLEVI